MFQVPSSNEGLIFHFRRGNAVSDFLKSIFIAKQQVLLLFSGINVPLPKVIFSQVFEKANCNAFKNVM